MAGRMTVNPLAHLDIMGSLMLLMVGLGYAKPVPVNPRNFRYKHADTYVAAAGPAMNFLLTLVGGLLWIILDQLDLLQTSVFPVHVLLFWFMFINMNLCLFNLIPLGPLDGSYVLPYFLSPQTRRKYELWNLQYGTYLILGLFVFGMVLPGWSPFRWISILSRGMIGMIIS
ncbi:MAG: site-2 protease family protein [SAR324 cluster bacterium]|nr:site-2 protease family protein [SAR324 cluster bacterium]